MSRASDEQALGVLREVYSAITALPAEDRARVVASVLVMLGIEHEVAGSIKRTNDAMRAMTNRGGV